MIDLLELYQKEIEVVLIGQGTVLCLRSGKNFKGTIKNLKGKYKWQHSNIILTWMQTVFRC